MALAITSFPVPVSPWIKTAEFTGATLSTSAINARNFGLDPIKSKVVIAMLLYECGSFRVFLWSSQLALGFIFLSRDPFPDIWIAIHQCNVSRFAPSKKSHAILTGQ